MRYYFNTLKTHTLEIHFGTDKFVTDLIVSEGIILPSGLSESDIISYISDWFYPHEGFGIWHRLKIGMGKKAALQWLGNPHEKLSEDHWRYYSKCSCELPSGIDLMFNDWKIVKIRFLADQG